MTAHGRSVVLRGTLQGEIYWPVGVEFQRTVSIDLASEAQRFINADGSGLVDAIRSTVDGAGDFRSAPRLTADSFIEVTHYYGNRARSRFIDVTDLPSISDYVDTNAYAFSED